MNLQAKEFSVFYLKIGHLIPDKGLNEGCYMGTKGFIYPMFDDGTHTNRRIEFHDYRQIDTTAKILDLLNIEPEVRTKIVENGLPHFETGFYQCYRNYNLDYTYLRRIDGVFDKVFKTPQGEHIPVETPIKLVPYFVGKFEKDVTKDWEFLNIFLANYKKVW